jgi:acyl-CoA thioesterase-1
MTQPVLDLKDVTLSLKGNAGMVEILHGISLSVHKGETLGLIGPSGSGKSSLLMVMGGLSRVEWSLSPSTDALIVALGGNDLLRGLDPSVSRANLEGILQIAEDKELEVLIVGMEAPGNYGPEYKAEFDAMYPELAEAYGAMYFPRFFEGLYSVGSTPAELRDVMQMDGIHPNAEGVDLIVEAMGPAVAELVKRAAE